MEGQKIIKFGNDAGVKPIDVLIRPYYPIGNGQKGEYSILEDTSW